MDNIIRVEEIMCEHCVKRVKNAMLEIDGITAVEIDLKKKKVSFTSDKEISMEVLNKKLNKDGYTATEYKEKKGLFKRR